jgi:hypothetical protein
MLPITVSTFDECQNIILRSLPQPSEPEIPVYPTNMWSPQYDFAECVQRLCKINFEAPADILTRKLLRELHHIMSKWLFACCFVAAGLLSTERTQQENSKLERRKQEESD